MMAQERAWLQWADFRIKHPDARLWEPFTYRKQIDDLKEQLKKERQKNS